MTDRVQPRGIRLVRRSPTELAVVPTLGSPESRRFPAEVVARLRLRPRRLVVGVVLGLVLAALTAAAVAPALVPDAVPDTVRDRAVGVALIASILLGFGLYGWGHPLGHVLAGAGAVPGLVAGGSVPVAAAFVALQAACAALAWRGWTARRRWWARLDALHERHRCVDGEVVAMQRSERSTSDFTAYWLWVASPDAPGLEWRVEAESTMRHRPAVGDPVRVWYHPADPEAAVLCVPEDVVGGRARWQAQAESAGAALARAEAAGDPEALRAAAARLPWPARPRAAVVPTAVLLVAVPAVDAAASFPAEVVERLRPRPLPRGAQVAVGLALAVLAAAVSGPVRVDLPAPALARVAALVGAAALAWLLAVRGGTTGLVLGAVLGQALATAGGGDGRASAGVTTLLAVLAWLTARRGAADGRRWAALAPLLEDRARVDGVVEHLDVRPGARAGDPVGVLVAATSGPARSWSGWAVVSETLRPLVGQPVAVWCSAMDPATAVLGVLDARAAAGRSRAPSAE